MTVSVAVMQQQHRTSFKRQSMSPVSNSNPVLPIPSVFKRRKPHVRRFAVAILLCAVICFTTFLLPSLLPNLFRAATIASNTTNHSLFPSFSFISTSHFRRLSRRTLRWYQRQLHLHPLSSRAITAAVIFFIADTAAQLLNRPKQKPFRSTFSLSRLCRYSTYGLLIMGPFLYVWYAAMNEYGPPDDLRGSLIKCLFDQLTLEPLCISLYILYDGLICRKGIKEIKKNLSTKFLSLWFKNAVFWLPANFANYYIGTPDLRVVFANLCSLFWNIYFSAKMNHTTIPNHERKHEPITDIEEGRSSSNSRVQEIRRNVTSTSQLNANRNSRQSIIIK